MSLNTEQFYVIYLPVFDVQTLRTRKTRVPSVQALFRQQVGTPRTASQAAAHQPRLRGWALPGPHSPPPSCLLCVGILLGGRFPLSRLVGRVAERADLVSAEDTPPGNLQPQGPRSEMVRLVRTQQEACGQQAAPWRRGWRVRPAVVVVADTLKPTYSFNRDREQSPAALGSGCAGSGAPSPAVPGP